MNRHILHVKYVKYDVFNCHLLININITFINFTFPLTFQFSCPLFHFPCLALVFSSSRYQTLNTESIHQSSHFLLSPLTQEFKSQFSKTFVVQFSIFTITTTECGVFCSLTIKHPLGSKRFCFSCLVFFSLATP